ncbi:CaiB/BaiF CoA-transferase family protein [Acidisphaera sp. S103]|uniref:CaiB/BaiF CoA transferase family protein n=1 Tax=Acidisphaera sp. S103 TaxID=1747223 RepID=UPI00131E3C21|nr:CoA transferase [Acidisphaera sp. S103]
MKPLTGIRILDLTKVLAGPLCTQYLGDLGAEVIKVEPCQIGDDTRRWPPFRDQTGAIFLSVNRNKRSLAVDLKTPEGQAIIHKLAAKADVVIESYGTGVAERLGIGYPALQALNPRLIYCSISGFGRTGPLGHALGYDVILQAFSGIMGMTGEEGGPPIRSPFSPIDQTTGLHAVSGIMAALIKRGQTGEGTQLEVSLYETAMSFLNYNFHVYWEKGVLPDKCGSGHESLVPYQAFEAADAPLLIGVANDNLWRRFCKAVERDDLADDPRFRTSPDRAANRELTVGIVQDIVRTRSRDTWIELLTGLGVPCAPINTLKDVLDHPHTAARGLVMEYPHPVLGPIKTIGQPIVFDGAPRQPGTPPPMLGEHSRPVLLELGYPDAEITRMAAAGVIVDGAQ